MLSFLTCVVGDFAALRSLSPNLSGLMPTPLHWKIFTEVRHIGWTEADIKSHQEDFDLPKETCRIYWRPCNKKFVDTYIPMPHASQLPTERLNFNKTYVILWYVYIYLLLWPCLEESFLPRPVWPWLTADPHTSATPRRWGCPLSLLPRWRYEFGLRNRAWVVVGRKFWGISSHPSTYQSMFFLHEVESKYEEKWRGFEERNIWTFLFPADGHPESWGQRKANFLALGPVDKGHQIQDEVVGRSAKAYNSGANRD